MFPRIEYLHWMMGRAEAVEHDLGSTDQRLGDAFDRLAGRDDPSDGRSLREQLAEELGVRPAQLLVTAGASHANFLAMAAALDDPAEEVAVESPGYGPIAATARGLGGTVRRFDRADDFALDPDRVSSTDQTALVAVTDRHNPSGRPASRAAIETIAAEAQGRGAWLLVDEVYAPFAAGLDDRPGFGAGTAAGLEGTVVTGSLTKYFGLGDLRIGWLVAETSFVERAEEVAAHVPTVSSVCTRLAGRLLARLRPSVAAARAHAAMNAAMLSRFLSRRDDLDGTVYGPCPFAFVDHRVADGDRVAAAARAAGILVVPGRFFGDRTRFRVAAAGPPEATEQGLAALDAVLEEL